MSDINTGEKLNKGYILRSLCKFLPRSNKEMREAVADDFITKIERDRAYFITTIESQKEKITDLESLIEWWEERASEAKCMAEATDKENIELKRQIESQKEEIERLQIDRSDWEEEYMSLKRRFEDLDKSALETLELLNGPNEQIESLKAITELAVKGLEEFANRENWKVILHNFTNEWIGEDEPYTVAQSTLSEIERLQNE